MRVQGFEVCIRVKGLGIHVNVDEGLKGLSVQVSQGMDRRCRCDVYDLSAVRFVYRYVI